MKSTTKKFVTLTLGLLLSCPWHAFVPVQAQSLKELRAQQQTTKPTKLAPDLAVMLADDDEEQRQAKLGKTLAQIRQERLQRVVQRAQEEGDTAPQRTRLGGLLLPSAEVLADEKQSFIVQLDSTATKVVLQEKVARLGGVVRQSHEGLGLVTIEAPRSAIRQLAADSSISYVSPDRLVSSLGHVKNTTGVENAGIVDMNDTNSSTWLDGYGNIAVLDSGIDSSHYLMRRPAEGNVARAVYNKDFTGQGISGDPYGHGTHVATLAGGDWNYKSGAYRGIADGASMINLRVLDDQGRGSVTNLIAAVNWCIQNKAAWNVRVMNMSLGTIAKDSYKTDPLCLAVRNAWNAGIVVVCAAGNDGKDINGQKVYGGIHSPGNDPSVITVGAANTFGTDKRSDDAVATYSSRGPTRSYSVDTAGVRHYDNLIKPDLIAPGNKVIGARSYSSGKANKLVTDYPSLKTGSDADATKHLMYLSGTSMSAPLVAGAASLLLETNPKLTPNLIKAILMYSAQPLKGFNMLEQGTDELNIDGAVRLARLVKSTLPTTNGASLLSASLPTTQASTIAGESCKWGQGVITNYGFLSGSNLMKYWQTVYGSGQILGDATVYSSGAVNLVSGKTYSITLKAGAYSITGCGLILGDSANILFASGQILGDGLILGDGIILGDGQILSDGIILGDGTTRSDTYLKPNAAYLGDNTACMQPVL